MKFSKLVILALVTLPATAAETGWYGGIGGGQSSGDDSFFSSRTVPLATMPGQTVTLSTESRSESWRAMAGYRLNGWLALEASYVDYGKLRGNYAFNAIVDGKSGAKVLIAPGTMAVDRGVTGVGAGVVLSAPPVVQNLNLFGRLGYMATDTQIDTRFTGGGVVPGSQSRSESSREGAGNMGVGAEYLFTRNVGARLEWERTTKVDTDAWTLGVLWRF